MLTKRRASASYSTFQPKVAQSHNGECSGKLSLVRRKSLGMLAGLKGSGLSVKQEKKVESSPSPPLQSMQKVNTHRELFGLQRASSLDRKPQCSVGSGLAKTKTDEQIEKPKSPLPVHCNGLARSASMKEMQTSDVKPLTVKAANAQQASDSPQDPTMPSLTTTPSMYMPSGSPRLKHKVVPVKVLTLPSFGVLNLDKLENTSSPVSPVNVPQTSKSMPTTPTSLFGMSMTVLSTPVLLEPEVSSEVSSLTPGNSPAMQRRTTDKEGAKSLLERLKEKKLAKLQSQQVPDVNLNTSGDSPTVLSGSSSSGLLELKLRIPFSSSINEEKQATTLPRCDSEPLLSPLKKKTFCLHPSSSDAHLSDVSHGPPKPSRLPSVSAETVHHTDSHPAKPLKPLSIKPVLGSESTNTDKKHADTECRIQDLVNKSDSACQLPAKKCNATSELGNGTGGESGLSNTQQQTPNYQSCLSLKSSISDSSCVSEINSINPINSGNASVQDSSTVITTQPSTNEQPPPKPPAKIILPYIRKSPEHDKKQILLPYHRQSEKQRESSLIGKTTEGDFNKENMSLPLNNNCELAMLKNAKCYTRLKDPTSPCNEFVKRYTKLKDSPSPGSDISIVATSPSISARKRFSDTRFSILDTPTPSSDYDENEYEDTEDDLITPTKFPEMDVLSCFDLASFTCAFLPQDNKPLAPKPMLDIRELLLHTEPVKLAKHLTMCDVKVLRCKEECQLGLGVTSGLELITLPQGSRLRQDLLER